ncbi:S41 family peptidase [Pelagerythrobacter marensis]|uniref:Carboxyl-terminal protease n=1 Tax=Pelagerythrobacter marensis TaxID=543877 RepID=A0A0G3X516_9SPHN|nr:S41 family peptidase [Pelagerythrobacter marensis]AKM06272.1 Carboxyl-terminal protease [Pelagerythrobacter marensis]
MGRGRTALSIVLASSLVACGGGGGRNDSGSGGPTSGNPTPTPTSGTSECSLSARQDFVRAVLDEWYLFPDLIATGVNKADHTDLQSYIDALVAPARAQLKDRYFTYITSIAEEKAYYNSGSNAGFGIRLGYDTGSNRVFVIEGFEEGPGVPQGLDRGVELLAVGTSASTLQNISDLMVSGGPQAVVNALGPSDPGVQRVFRIREAGGTERQITVTKTEHALDPVSDRYGARILNDGGKKVGYINLRTFIGPAEADLREAFANFQAQGVTEVIVDFRYNGGGLVEIAELMGDLMGRGHVGQVFSRTTLRPSKSSENETRLFGAQNQAIAPTKIAFIGTGGTASASELVTNAFTPYLGTDMALVGTNTYGKPVGQYGFDRRNCDDRLRAVTFKTDNADGQGEYFTGLASVVPVTCRATDDILTPLGDPGEASIAQALAFLRGGAGVCSAISGRDATAAQSGATGRSITAQREVLQPDRPTPAQRETPGLF